MNWILCDALWTHIHTHRETLAVVWEFVSHTQPSHYYHFILNADFVLWTPCRAFGWVVLLTLYLLWVPVLCVTCCRCNEKGRPSRNHNEVMITRYFVFLHDSLYTIVVAALRLLLSHWMLLQLLIKYTRFYLKWWHPHWD